MYIRIDKHSTNIKFSLSRVPGLSTFCYYDVQLLIFNVLICIRIFLLDTKMIAELPFQAICMNIIFFLLTSSCKRVKKHRQKNSFFYVSSAPNIFFLSSHFKHAYKCACSHVDIPS